jgi:hypothetical protein
MLVTEVMLQSITKKIFRSIFSHDDNQAGRTLYDLNTMELSFQQALSKAFKQFEERYPQWTLLLIDSGFLEKEGISILAQFLQQNGKLVTDELAILWLRKANLVHPEWHITTNREIEPVVVDFLDYVVQSLASTHLMEMFNNAQTLEWIAHEITTIRRKLHTKQSTPGTRRDYLDWLINYTMYIDGQGTTLGERQTLHIKLSNVYVSLNTKPNPGLNQGESENSLHSNILLEPEDPLQVAEAVERFDHLVLLGDPGSGKTTLQHYLAHQYAQALLPRSTESQAQPGTSLFPILLRIADYAEQGLSQNLNLKEFLAQACIMNHCPADGLDDLLTTALIEETCLILLDGLDEVLNTEIHSRVVNQIEVFVNSYTHRPHRFLITSRPTGYSTHRLGKPFVHYHLCEMNDSQIHEFLESWCLAVEAAQTPDLSVPLREAKAHLEVDGILRAVQASPGVRPLASNPLMLRIIALIRRAAGRLPRRRVELYDQAAKILLQSWHLHLTLIEDAYFVPLLSYLAFWMHTRKPNGLVTEQEVHQVLHDEWIRIKGPVSEEDEPTFVQEVRTFLRRVRDRAGLLVERASQQYSFLRLSFQEYYAGRYLVSNSRNRAPLIYEHRHEPRWEEPILLGLGFVGLTSPEDATDLLEAAILAQGDEAKKLGFAQSSSEELLRRDYLFAIRCLGEQIPIRPSLERQLIERFAQELLYQYDSVGPLLSHKQELWKSLEYVKGSRSARTLSSLLIKALDNSDPEVRIRAAEGLGILEQSSDEVVTALRKKLNDPNLKVRYWAAESLRQLGHVSDNVIRIFLQTLRMRESVDPTLRRLAVRSLGQLGRSSDEVVNALISALRDTAIRDQAQKSLALLEQSDTTSPAEKSAIDQFFSLWKNLETSAFSQLVQSFIDALTKACELPLVGPPFSIGDWILAAVDVTSLFEGLVLPSPILALVFKQQKSFDRQDLDQMRELIRDRIAPNCKLALLILFGDDARLRQTQEMARTTHTFAFDVAVPTRDTISQILTAHNPTRDLRSLLLRHINLPSISPFTIIGPTKHTFFGRHSELSEIRDGASRTSYLLIGGRVIGKTSILHQLFHVWLKEEFQPYLFSCQEIPNDKPTRDDFLMTVTQLWLPDSTYEQKFSFAYIVRQLARKYHKPPVFLLDEADRLVSAEQATGWPLFGEMRALAEKGACQFVLAGEEVLSSTIQENSRSPFHNFTKKLPVGLLDKDSVFELITQTMKHLLEIELVQENTILESIYKFTSGHPNVVQRLCERLLQTLRERQLRQITPADVEHVIQSPAFQRDDFLRIFWNHATILEKSILLVMSEESKNYYSILKIRKKIMKHWEAEIELSQIQQALERLQELRNILKSTQKGYTFAVDAFPEVIGRNVMTEDLLAVFGEQFQKYGDIASSQLASQARSWVSD